MPSDADNSPSESESARAVASAASESENKHSKYQLAKLKQSEGCSGYVLPACKLTNSRVSQMREHLVRLGLLAVVPIEEVSDFGPVESDDATPVARCLKMHVRWGSGTRLTKVRRTLQSAWISSAGMSKEGL